MNIEKSVLLIIIVLAFFGGMFLSAGIDWFDENQFRCEPDTVSFKEIEPNKFNLAITCEPTG